MIMKQLFRTVAAGAVVASMSLAPAFVSSASADPLLVTFDPSGVGLTTSGLIAPFQSDQQLGFDAARAVITNSTGAFTESGFLRFSSFNNGGDPVTNSGIGSDYSLYMAFSGTGVLPGFDAAHPLNSNGSFSSVSYALFGIAGPTIAGSLVLPTLGNNPTLFGQSPDDVLTNLSLLPGAGVLLATGGTGVSAVGINGLGVPTASVVLSLTQSGTSFFLAPPDVNGFSATFSNASGNSSVTIGASTTEVLIRNGSFDNNFIRAVPEPASLTLLGTGLLGLGAIIRRRSAKKAS